MKFTVKKFEELTRTKNKQEITIFFYKLFGDIMLEKPRK
jgi:hypothetical protein